MTTQQLNALFKLNDFCNNHKIEYAVTGTCALSILGMPAKSLPDDIDIIVFHPTDAILRALKELENLSVYPKVEYEKSITYTFEVGGVKVNAMIDPKSSYEDMERDLLTIAMTDEVACRRHLISIQKMNKAWAAKMALARPKDIAYAVQAINFLTTPLTY